MEGGLYALPPCKEPDVTPNLGPQSPCRLGSRWVLTMPRHLAEMHEDGFLPLESPAINDTLGRWACDLWRIEW